MSRFGSAGAFALFIAIVPAGSAVASSADAAEAGADGAPAAYPQIHLEVSPAESPVVPLLRAELTELGLEVIEGPVTSPSITIHAVLARDSLEVRISDDQTGSTVLREVFSVANSRSMDPRTAVLHASELLRWHLHYRTAVSAPVPQTSAPAASKAKPPPSAELRLGVLPLAMYSPGGMQVGLGAQLELSRRWSWLEVRALGATSLVPNRMSVPAGQLQASSAWLGLEGALAWEPGKHGTGIELGLGAALFTAGLRGTSNSDNVGRDDRVLTLAPLVELRAEQRITRSFALVLASQCLLPLEALRLRVLEQQVGRYGRQVLTLGLGLELTLF